MPKSPEDTTAWVVNILREKSDIVTHAEATGPQTITISRPHFEPFQAAIISISPLVQITDVQTFVEPSLDVSIVANVPKSASWSGPAIDYLSQRNLAWGTLGDLYSAVQAGDVRSYIRSEFRFFERVMRQHDKVAHTERVNEKVYTIHRIAPLRPITVVLINEYELTGDHIRTARDHYGAFDAVLRNNPNGGSTSDARAIADQMGAPIFEIRQLLGRLNSR